MAVAGLSAVAAAVGALPGFALVTDPARVTATSAVVLLTGTVTWLVLAPGAPRRADDDAEAAADEYLASPIPCGQVRGGDGVLVTLRELPAAQAVLLVFLSQGCGPCRRVQEALPELRARVSPAVRIDVGRRRARHGCRGRSRWQDLGGSRPKYGASLRDQGSAGGGAPGSGRHGGWRAGDRRGRGHRTHR